MNERIRELFQQSSIEAFDHTVIGSNPRDYVCIYNKVFDPEKFAESIVDECCLKLLNMDEKTKGSHNYYKHAALEIKKHFGVEE